MTTPTRCAQLGTCQSLSLPCKGCDHFEIKLGLLQIHRDLLRKALTLIEVDKDGDGFVCREAMNLVRAAQEFVKQKQ